MQMWIYVVRRLFLLIPIIIGVMTITFVLTSALPVQQRFIAAHGTPPVRSPWQYNQYLTPGQGVCPATSKTDCPNPLYNTLLNQLGLNKPIPEQWAIYMYHSLTFQWGVVGNDSTASQTITIIKGQPVTTVLTWFLPYTIELALLSLTIILLIAIPFGNLAAVNRNRPIDQGARVISFSGFAVAPFLLSSLVLIAVVVLLGASSGYHTSSPWCPGSGEGTFFEFYGSWPQSTCFANAQYPSWLTGGVVSHPTGFPTVDAMIHHQYWLALDSLIRIILPALVIAFGSIAVLLRFVRNSMLEVMNLDFVRTARAEGIPEKTVVKRHAGRNSLNVTITVLGLTFAFFIGGFPVIEDVFHLNGVGLMLALAVQQSVAPIDFGLVFGTTILFTYIVVIANIIVDVLYAYLDPRVRLG